MLCRSTNLFRTFSTGKFRRVQGYDGLVKRIDAELGVPTELCVEYLFTKPKWRIAFFSLFKGSQTSGNPYGHSAIRYVNPDTGKDTVMNVCGLKGHKLINFIPADEYLFTDIFHDGNEQGGIFNRSFIGMRVEKVPVEDIRKLHRYYEETQRKNDEGKVKFFILPLSFLNPIRKLLGFPEYGNCSYWTSKGLKKISLIPYTYTWPLLLFFELIRAQKPNKFSRVNIVSYQSITHPTEPKGSLIYPFYWWKRGYDSIWNLDDMANVILKIDSTDQLSGTPLKPTPSDPHPNTPRDKDSGEVIVEDTINREEHLITITLHKSIEDRYNEMIEKLKNIFKRP